MIGKPILSGISIFRNLGPITLDELSVLLTKKEYLRGDEILEFEEQEGKIFVVLEGRVDFCRLSFEGKEAIFASLGKGDIFGDIFFGSSREFLRGEIFAQAGTKVTLGIFPRNELLDLLLKKPSSASDLFFSMSNRVMIAEEKVSDRLLFPLKQGILKVLVHLSRLEGGESGSFYAIRSGVTHEQLAKMLGVSREAVTREIAKLKKGGAIIKGKRYDYQLNKSYIKDSS